MELAKDDSFVMLRLEHGEDILESIALAAKDEKSTMLIMTGLGMISEFELGYFDRGGYLTKSFTEPHELLSLQGSISSEGENRLHVHASVADKQHRAFGGHLMRGKVWMSNEIGIARLRGVSSVRAVDPEKKVGILHLR